MTTPTTSVSDATTPAHAACGCPEGGGPLAPSRRVVLAGASALGAAGATLAMASPAEALTRLTFADAGYTGDTVVVLSFRGGIDGLSVVAPVGDPAYYAARPTIAVP
ncbi:MAG: hypothetical protein IE926_05400, partial [Micrococcales bacterium]|nr:hypothetical protein [Micrococcales bacterium]